MPIPDFTRWHGRVVEADFSKLMNNHQTDAETEQMAYTVHSRWPPASYSALICGPSVPGLQCPLRLSSVNRSTHNPFACFRVSRVRILSCFVLPRGPGMSLQAGIDNTMRRPRWESGYCRCRPPRSIGKPSVSTHFGPGSAAPGLGHIILPNVIPGRPTRH